MLVPGHLLQVVGQGGQRGGAICLGRGGIKVGEQLQGSGKATVDLNHVRLGRCTACRHVNDQLARTGGQPFAGEVAPAGVLESGYQNGRQAASGQPLVKAVMAHAHAISNALNREVFALLGKLFAQAQALDQTGRVNPFPIAPAHWKSFGEGVKTASKQMVMLDTHRVLFWGHSWGFINQPLECVMTDREAMLQMLGKLTSEVQRLQMAQTVQRSAYVVLVRHLAAQGLARPDMLVKDFETMALTQPDEDWQSGHAELADVIQLVSELPSAHLKSAVPLPW